MIHHHQVSLALSMKKVLLFLFLASFISGIKAQSNFDIENYDIKVGISKNATLQITETIDVFFNSPSHGIIRWIPYQYQVKELSDSVEVAEMDLTSRGKRRTILENIQVENDDFDVSNADDYYKIKIGNRSKLIEGKHRYIIQYNILNAINFFKDKSEFYFNLIGDKWNANIKKVHFSIVLPKPLSQPPHYFIATGITGSKENQTQSQWSDSNRLLSGKTMVELKSGEGLTVGVSFPKGYLTKPNFFIRNIQWLLLPLFVFIFMFILWYKKGKDDNVTITTMFYPPKGVSPSICGYIIDDRLDKRDLTALIPYWGANGYIRVKEMPSTVADMGFGVQKDYEFEKLKEISDDSMSFEKTLFNGIFESGDKVLLSDLKNVLYASMNVAKQELEMEVDREEYYEKNSRGLGYFLGFMGLIAFGLGLYYLLMNWGFGIWKNLSVAISGLITMFFAFVMAKKTQKGNELYAQLAGFKEFIKKVEQPRLEQFLKEDSHYFDKVLPFAIVFDLADNWKDKLKNLDVPPPDWYVGNYSGFTTYLFLSSLTHSLNTMSDSFYSTPSSTAASGGSFSDVGGGGGFSGGGFGGGGGDSW